MKKLTRLSLLVTTFLVLIAMVLPDAKLSVIRAHIHWMDAGLSWLKIVSPRLDLDHVIAFSLLGAVTRLSLARAAPWRALAALAMFAALTELAQMWVPGRTASVLDAGLDVLGALLGYTLATLLTLRVRRAPAAGASRTG